jgi:hypothetical protein
MKPRPGGLLRFAYASSFKVALGLYLGRGWRSLSSIRKLRDGRSDTGWIATSCEKKSDVPDVQWARSAPLRAYPSWMQGSVGRICYDGVTTVLAACANYPRRHLCLLASRLILDKDTTSFVVRSHA